MPERQPNELHETRDTDSSATDPNCDTIEGIPLLTEATKDRLDERRQVDYAIHRREWLRWSLSMGKDPENFEAYSVSTMKSRAYRVDRFFRWLWAERRDGYTTAVDAEDAEAYMKELAFRDESQEHKSNTMKALRTYFTWRHEESGDEGWEPERTFSSPNRQDNSADALDRSERRQIREAALEYGSIPHYNSLSPSERDEWKTYLAQQLETPKEDVTKSDWDRVNDWKFPSLVWTSLDAALRPIEVETATVDWVDLDRGRLVIPKDEAAKTDRASRQRRWTPVLTDRTVEALRRWLEQRKHYDRYEGRDNLWLTKEGNPYDSGNLSYLIDRLCEIAEIDTPNRDVSWYSIRRGTVTELIDAADLSTAAEQVRHRDIRSTRRYDQAPERRRREALEQIN